MKQILVINRHERHRNTDVFFMFARLGFDDERLFAAESNEPESRLTDLFYPIGAGGGNDFLPIGSHEGDLLFERDAVGSLCLHELNGLAGGSLRECLAADGGNRYRNEQRDDHVQYRSCTHRVPSGVTDVSPKKRLFVTQAEGESEAVN